MQPITIIQFAVRVGAYARTNTDAPCMFMLGAICGSGRSMDRAAHRADPQIAPNIYGRCLGGNLCQI